jgi:hypothetical protein
MTHDRSFAIEDDTALAAADGDDSIHAASDGDPDEPIEPMLEDE